MSSTTHVCLHCYNPSQKGALACTQLHCVGRQYLVSECDANGQRRNHPIIKDDGILAAFLTEPSFETWRKNSPISLEEESLSKKVDKVEEMSIPSDFDDKIA